MNKEERRHEILSWVALIISIAAILTQIFRLTVKLLQQ